MNRIDRLFGILTLLQSRKYVTAEKIAEKFDMSIRTVYRDIKALCEQGIPVSFEQNKGYFVVKDYFLPPVSFTTDEANAFLLMETLVYGFSDKSIQTHYSSAMNKVRSVLRNSQKEKLELLNDNIKLQVPSFVTHDYEYLSPLQSAISSRKIVHIGYTNNNGDISDRAIEPIGLIFYALNWHLIAWCHKRLEYRDFRVSRIMNIKCGDSSFTKTDHMDLNDYLGTVPVSW